MVHSAQQSSRKYLGILIIAARESAHTFHNPLGRCTWRMGHLEGCFCCGVGVLRGDACARC